MRPGALPLYEQILYDIFIPPAGTIVCWLMCKGLAIQLGTSNSEVVRGWTRSGFWIVLCAAYTLMFSITIYTEGRGSCTRSP